MMTAFLLYMLCLTTGFFCSGGVDIEINDLLPKLNNMVYLRGFWVGNIAPFLYLCSYEH